MCPLAPWFLKTPMYARMQAATQLPFSSTHTQQASHCAALAAHCAHTLTHRHGATGNKTLAKTIEGAHTRFTALVGGGVEGGELSDEEVTALLQVSVLPALHTHKDTQKRTCRHTQGHAHTQTHLAGCDKMRTALRVCVHVCCCLITVIGGEAGRCAWRGVCVHDGRS